LSHNSYAQIVAARLCRIPVVTAMDYEHQPANHLAFRLAHAIVVPEVFPDAALRRFGAPARRVRRYEGLKEEVYTRPSERRERAGAPIGVPLAVLRLPPEGALYRGGENELVELAVAELTAQGAAVVVLARTNEQRALWRARSSELLIVPDPPVDAEALLSETDLFVGAGGTMTREAAVLGVPTASIFSGPPAAVDEWLAGQGRLTLVRSKETVSSLRVVEGVRLPALEARGAGSGLAAVLHDALDEVS
jgi:predicted glycosyltransferase